MLIAPKWLNIGTSNLTCTVPGTDRTESLKRRKTIAKQIHAKQKQKERQTRVARYPVFYRSSRISAPISRLPERSYLAVEISHI